MKREKVVMNASKMVSLQFVLGLIWLQPLMGQGCESLRNASPEDLTSFISTVVPSQNNLDCITAAIRKISPRQQEAAIPGLVRLLDFKRPLEGTEKYGSHSHMRGISDWYPAVEALEAMGPKALPALLDVIKADKSSMTARENAVAAWMEIYRQTDEHPKAIALLKQAQTTASDSATQKRLDWALKKALTWCNPPEVAACQRASVSGTYSANSN